MAFKMQCPKCGSTSLYLEEDQKAFVGGGRYQVQLHCYMCGKVIYGQDAIEKEYKKQHGEWLATGDGEGIAARGSDDLGEDVSDESSTDSGAVPKGGSSSEKECAWRDCNKAARPRSKYCSRNCSNKNARSRYSRRNDDEQAA